MRHPGSSSNIAKRGLPARTGLTPECLAIDRFLSFVKPDPRNVNDNSRAVNQVSLPVGVPNRDRQTAVDVDGHLRVGGVPGRSSATHSHFGHEPGAQCAVHDQRCFRLWLHLTSDNIR